MSDFTKELEAALRKESLQDRTFAAMITLAEEYNAKTITTERFAHRVFDMLLSYATAMQKQRDKPAAAEGSAK
jgi:hypothetical protein